MNLDDIRNEIDSIDDKMLELFLKRMELAENAMQQKKANGNPVMDKTREREILADITEKSGEMSSYSRRLFKELMTLSRSYQNRRLDGENDFTSEIKQSVLTDATFPRGGRIACQGIEGSYSQQAADKMFPQGDIMFFKSFAGVCEAVKSGFCDYGILPIENSIYGSVHEVYDLLKEGNYSIIRSTKLCINHKLLAKPNTKPEDIKEIISHEQAFGQCSEFINSLADTVKITECANTAVAAKIASEKEDTAAIASVNCTETYNLASINDNIQNSDNNYTRFVCISSKHSIYAGANKISFIATCRHEPGALYKILSGIDAMGINITKLESKPIPSSDFDFMFFFVIEASVMESGIPELLNELKNNTESFVFLGNYSEV